MQGLQATKWWNASSNLNVSLVTNINVDTNCIITDNSHNTTQYTCIGAIDQIKVNDLVIIPSNDTNTIYTQQCIIIGGIPSSATSFDVRTVVRLIFKTICGDPNEVNHHTSTLFAAMAQYDPRIMLNEYLQGGIQHRNLLIWIVNRLIFSGDHALALEQIIAANDAFVIEGCAAAFYNTNRDTKNMICSNDVKVLMTSTL
eukprot:711637_1